MDKAAITEGHPQYIRGCEFISARLELSINLSAPFAAGFLGIFLDF
jgi:hypothetical protein